MTYVALHIIIFLSYAFSAIWIVNHSCHIILWHIICGYVSTCRKEVVPIVITEIMLLNGEWLALCSKTYACKWGPPKNKWSTVFYINQWVVVYIEPLIGVGCMCSVAGIQSTLLPTSNSSHSTKKSSTFSVLMSPTPYHFHYLSHK